MKILLFVFLGGGLGSVLRYLISLGLNQDFPYGTWLVNLLGSFLIGIFLGLNEKNIFSSTQLALLAIGFCGGFTTFSTFSAESLKMIENQQYLVFSIHVFGSVILGILFVFLGFKLAK